LPIRIYALIIIVPMRAISSNRYVLLVIYPIKYRYSLYTRTQARIGIEFLTFHAYARHALSTL